MSMIRGLEKRLKKFAKLLLGRQQMDVGQGGALKPANMGKSLIRKDPYVRQDFDRTLFSMSPRLTNFENFDKSFSKNEFKIKSVGVIYLMFFKASDRDVCKTPPT